MHMHALEKFSNETIWQQPQRDNEKEGRDVFIIKITIMEFALWRYFRI